MGLTDLFLLVANMAITASWLIIAVIVLRLLLRRAPKKLHCVLWALVAIRLFFPLSLESPTSLIPTAKPVTVSQNSVSVQLGLPIIDAAVSGVQTPAEGEITPPADVPSETPAELPTKPDTANGPAIINTVAYIWLGGFIVMAGYGCISYIAMRRKLATAVRLYDNIYQSEYVSSPFVLGMVNPKIYLPYSIKKEDAVHIIAHERAHIARLDNIWKPFAFGLLTVYWFAPPIWAAYILLCRDIELACDEKATKDLNLDERCDYSQTLLSYGIRRFQITACPIAFGESGVKTRIDSVLHYKKPTFWVISLATLACIFTAMFFLTDPVNAELTEEEPPARQDSAQCAHVWDDWTVVKEATCTVAGTETRRCAACSIHEDRTIPASGHLESGWIIDRAALAGVDGEKHLTCFVCGKTIRTEVIPALEGAHVHEGAEWVERRKAGCTFVGYRDLVCACGAVIDTVTTPAVGHLEVVDAAVPATCTSEGLTEGSHCANCNKVIVARQIVPKTAHIYVNGKCECGKLPDSIGLQYTEHEGYYLVSGMGTCTDDPVVVPEYHNGRLVIAVSYGGFFGTRGVREIILPSTLWYVSCQAFGESKELERFTMPPGAANLHYRVFANCTRLREVEVLSNLVLIDEECFEGCVSLRSINIPNTLITIGARAFHRCNKLEEITLPTSLEEIGESAFSGCTNLTIHYAGTMKQFSRIRKGANWAKGVPGGVVHCTDGDFAI